MEAREQSPVTDSPWFWVLIFSGMALAALLAIGPKYGGRQARLERQYQARERIAAERASGNNEVEAARISHQAERRGFASADDTLIPLWPLVVVLSVVIVVAATMLIRGRPGSLSRKRPGLFGGEGPS
jgi:hypothetical protein